MNPSFLQGENPIFPAAYSTLKTTALAGVVSEKYGLSHVNCQFVLRGVGDTYLAETSAGRSVPVLSPRQLQSLGREMARFHDVSAMFEPAALESAALEPDVILGPGGAGGTNDPGGAGDGRWRFDPETTLFGPLAQLEPYFSEDPVGYGWLVNDIMTFWHHLRIEAILGRMTREGADEAFVLFLAVYQSCRLVSEQELEAIPYLSFGFWLFYMSFHTTHDQLYPFIQPAHLKLRLGLI